MSNNSDSDEEVADYAPNQALPIANLPVGFDGVPQDGMEYLFTVRRDSRLLPRYTRVELPHIATIPQAVGPSTSKTLHAAFPSDEWRTEYLRNFSNYRQNLRHALKAEKSTEKIKVPNWQSHAEWWKFITGSGSSEPHEPTVSMLKQFSTRNTMWLLYWFSVWVTEYADSLEEPGLEKDSNEETPGVVEHRIDSIHHRWMFALLGLLDTELVGSDISTLRVLARGAIRLVQVVIAGDDAASTESRVEETSPEGGTSPSTAAGCWMVVAAIVGVWGQRDIWDEAREALSR